MGADLFLDLPADGFQARRPSPDAPFDRAAVQHRQLENVGVGNNAGDGPTSRARHFHLALDRRLGHLQIGEKLPAVENLSRDLAVGGRHLAQIILDETLRRCKAQYQRTAQQQRLVGACNPRQGRYGKGRGGCRNESAARDARTHEYPPWNLFGFAPKPCWRKECGFSASPARSKNERQERPALTQGVDAMKSSLSRRDATSPWPDQRLQTQAIEIAAGGAGELIYARPIRAECRSVWLAMRRTTKRINAATATGASGTPCTLVVEEGETYNTARPTRSYGSQPFVMACEINQAPGTAKMTMYRNRRGRTQRPVAATRMAISARPPGRFHAAKTSAAMAATATTDCTSQARSADPPRSRIAAYGLANLSKPRAPPAFQISRIRDGAEEACPGLNPNAAFAAAVSARLASPRRRRLANVWREEDKRRENGELRLINEKPMREPAIRGSDPM